MKIIYEYKYKSSDTFIITKNKKMTPHINNAIKKWSTNDIERRIEEAGGYNYLNSMIKELERRKVKDKIDYVTGKYKKLKFNENIQELRLTNKDLSEEWQTITDFCTKKEFAIFEAYLNINPPERFTYDYVIECLAGSTNFLKNLHESNYKLKKY